MLELTTMLFAAALAVTSAVLDQQLKPNLHLDAAANISSPSQSRNEAYSKVEVSDPDGVSVAARALAPNFTLTDINGREFSLESLRGKVVLINFWASWCPFCVEDMPLMQELQNDFKQQGLVVVAINLEDAETARAFMQEHGYTVKTLMDADNQVSQLYKIEVLPTVVLIGRDGKIATRLMGAKSKSTLTEAIASAGIKNGSRDA